MALFKPPTLPKSRALRVLQPKQFRWNKRRTIEFALFLATRRDWSRRDRRTRLARIGMYSTDWFWFWRACVRIGAASPRD